jgi:hypothetical protein
MKVRLALSTEAGITYFPRSRVTSAVNQSHTTNVFFLLLALYNFVKIYVFNNLTLPS